MKKLFITGLAAMLTMTTHANNDNYDSTTETSG